MAVSGGTEGEIGAVRSCRGTCWGPTPIRLCEYPGAVYHVVNRGDHREEIFRDDPDRDRFLSTLTAACGKTEWQVHAYPRIWKGGGPKT